MTNIKSKDTAIEVKLRKALWKKGYRYRKNHADLLVKLDIVLGKYRIVIFYAKDWKTLKPRLQKSNNGYKAIRTDTIV